MPNFRGEDDLVAPVLQGASEQLLVRFRAVELGGVEERAPELDRAMDRADGLAFVGRAVEGAHAHAAEAHVGDGQVVELAHHVVPFR
jgi:hypothetical protein